MTSFEVRELHELHWPLRWGVFENGVMVGRFTTDAEAYRAAARS